MWVKHTPVLRKGSSIVFACLLQVVKVPFTCQVLCSRQYGVMHQIRAADALNVGKNKCFNEWVPLRHTGFPCCSSEHNEVYSQYAL